MIDFMVCRFRFGVMVVIVLLLFSQDASTNIYLIEKRHENETENPTVRHGALDNIMVYIVAPCFFLFHVHIPLVFGADVPHRRARVRRQRRLDRGTGRGCAHP